ncbi:hypothetical protein [Streptomyces diastaticus]
MILDGTVLPIDRVAADQPCEQLKHCGCSANRQVAIDADSRLGVVVGRPLLGHRNEPPRFEWRLDFMKGSSHGTTFPLPA